MYFQLERDKREREREIEIEIERERVGDVSIKVFTLASCTFCHIARERDFFHVFCNGFRFYSFRLGLPD